MNGEQLLGQATRTLREHTDAGWIALRDDVVAAAVRAFRPSAPVHGRAADGELWVASTVLVSAVRWALTDIADAGPQRVTCTTTPDGELERLTVEVIALYDVNLVAVADQVRAAAARAVAETLGFNAPPVERIVVDISIQDVTVDRRML